MVDSSASLEESPFEAVEEVEEELVAEELVAEEFVAEKLVAEEAQI